MPDRNGEKDWEVQFMAISEPANVVEALRQAIAIQYYHQYHLHRLENKIPSDKQKIIDEAFSLLTDDQKIFLEREHRAVGRHNY